VERVADPAAEFADATRAANAAPSDWTAQARLAEAAERVGAIKFAAKAAFRWASLAPGQWQAHATLGRLSMDLGRGWNARSALGRARDLNPTHTGIQVDLALLDSVLGRRRRAALMAVERFVASGHLGRDALAAVADANVESRTRGLAFMSSYLSLGYLILVLAHNDIHAVNPTTWYWPLLASGVVAAGLLWWAIPLWRRLPAGARRLLPSMIQREPLGAIAVIGHSAAMLMMIAVLPSLWLTGVAGLAMAGAVISWLIPVVTEIITVGIGLSTRSPLGDYLRVLGQPPYIVVGVIMMAIAAGLMRALARLVAPRSKRRSPR